MEIRTENSSCMGICVCSSAGYTPGQMTRFPEQMSRSARTLFLMLLPGGIFFFTDD
jgi:hypothetical protein